VSAAPRVAVVVGAYSRGAYLREAVDSVLAQSLPRDALEILVTKNFSDPEMDAGFQRDGVSLRFDDTPRIGTWLLAAIRATRAPIVALLDDDDLFAPDRLQRALEVFDAHPDVGFYRNRVEIVDPSGRPTPVDSWPPRGRDRYFDARGPTYVGSGGKQDLVPLLFRETRVSFNSSTMAFRRELLDGRRGEHFAETRLPDSSLLLNAVVSPYGLFLDDRRLTRHRVHPSNVTRNTGWLRWAIESNRNFALEAREFARPDFAEFYERSAVHYDRMLRSGEMGDRMDGGAERREIAQRAAEYARFLARHPEERRWTRDVWGIEAYAASYLVSPGIARRVRRRRDTDLARGPSVPAG